VFRAVRNRVSVHLPRGRRSGSTGPCYAWVTA
jgi:hypothetical protein